MSTATELTKVWILDIPATDWTDCPAAITAIQGGKEAMCTQEIGDIIRTRPVTTKTCINRGKQKKSAGGIEYGSIDITMEFNATDTEGQQAIEAAFEANKHIIFAYENSDVDTTVGTTKASGTIYWTKALVAGDVKSYPVDDDLVYKFTVEPYDGWTKCAAVAGTA